MTGNLSGRWVLAILVAFFGVIIGVNSVFIVEAASTFRGEDEEEPYLQGVEFNKTLQRRAEQAVLGWNASLSARRDASGRVRVQVAMRDRSGQPLERLTIVARLRHPVDSAHDRIIALMETGNGNYAGSATGVGPGVWDVLIQLASPKTTAFEADRRIWLR